MELYPSGKSVQHGFFLDPGRFRKALGEDVYESLRYYETAAEVTYEENNASSSGAREDNENPVPKSQHRFVLLTEAVLFVLDVSKKEAKKNLWAGEGAHAPIFLKNILSIQPLAKRSEVFAEDEINKTVRHFEIIYQERRGEKGSKPAKKKIELAAWESGSLLLNQIRSAWINLVIRLCLRVDISIQLDQDESKSLIFDLYNEIVCDIVQNRQNDVQVVMDSLQELANAALHDREIKRFFYTMPTLYQHLLGELESCKLPPHSLEAFMRKRQQQQKQQNQQLSNFFPSSFSSSTSTLRFTSRIQQLEYVEAILQLFHCMTFNSQTVLERSNLLKPLPFSFSHMLEIITIQYNHSSVQRTLHKMEQHAAAMDQKLKMLNHGSDEVDENDEFDYDDDDEDDLDDEDDFDDEDGNTNDNERNGNMNSDAGRDAKDLLKSINEIQVAILIELEDFISLAVSQGRSRSIVSETLSNQLSKSGYDFARYALPKYIKHVVYLLETWQANILCKQKSKQKRVDWSGLSVRIYQHIKLIHMLILGNYQMLEHILDNCEEELRYYLFKDEFNGKLRNIPERAKHYVQISVLNHISRSMIFEIRSAIEDLQNRRNQEIKDRSVLIM